MRSAKAVLIIGGSGFIGTHLALKLRAKYKIYTTYCKNPVHFQGVTCIPMNVLDRNTVKKIIYTIKPSAIVYAVGSSDPVWVEANAKLAEHIDADGLNNVVTVADIFQPKFIYLSNSYVFDGRKGNYAEGDTQLPITTLGKIKISSENFVKGRCFNYNILRSSPIYGRGNSWRPTFLDLLRQPRAANMEIPRIELQNFAPIDGLVEMVEKLIDFGPRNKIFHYGGLNKLTAYDLAIALANRFGLDPKLIVAQKYPAVKGVPITGPIYDYSLNFSSAVETLKINPLLLQKGFDLLQKNLVA